MKRYVTSLLVCGALLTSMATKAQAQSPLSFGVKAGVSLSGSSTYGYDMRVGFVGGVVVDYDLSKNLFLRSGLEFVMKGGKLDTKRRSLDKPSVYNVLEDQIRLNYLQLPIVVGYRTDIGNGIKGYVNAGPYLAYGVYGKGKGTYTENSGMCANIYDDLTRENFDELNLRKFDFGLTGSIGIEYSSYFINIGYEYGLTNSTKKMSESTSSWHNMNGTCTLGYKF